MEVGNLATNFKAAIDNRFKQRLDALISSGSGDVGFYNTADTTAFNPSSPAPTTKDHAYWRNRGQLLERTTHWNNRRSAKNAEFVGSGDKVTVAYATPTNYNLNLGNYFYTSATGNITINGSNETSHNTNDSWTWEIFNNSESAITATFESGLFAQFSTPDGIPIDMPVQTISAFGTRLFTFTLVDPGEVAFLISDDDIQGATSANLSDGVYTPTITKNESTDTVLTVYRHMYSRTDSTVDVVGKILINCVGSTIVTSFQISLPPGITSNFTLIDEDVMGVATVHDTGFPPLDNTAYAYADTSNDRMVVVFKADEDITKDQLVSYQLTFLKK
jgi:hypothetical protein